MGLSLVCHETLLAVKAPLAKDAVNYLGKTTIELRNWTPKRMWPTEAPAKLRLCSRPNNPTKWNSHDATWVSNYKPRALSLEIVL
jgi:hypothetical protein